MEEDVKYWVDIAKYDLDTAEAMLSSARYIYVLFMCQQALEKLLKAHVTKTTGSFPPRSHNLTRLVELSGLKLNDEDQKFIERLNYYYLESRYPHERDKLARDVTKKVAEEYYKKSKEFFLWLKKNLI